MADFETVLSIRGPKLSDLSQHVRDVLALGLAEPDRYEVGKLTLASYDFVPYALSGLSAAVQAPGSGARASTHVTLPLSDDSGGTATAEQDVTLYGPGDVLGVDAAQIVRRYPAPGSTNAEDTFHAHIEFDRPELPWAFSAHDAGDRMPAWLALVVFERSEVKWEPAQAGLQPIAAVDASLLAPLDTAWAWGHAQAAGGSASLSARLSTAYAPVNVGRLLAARVLAQNTDYVACLVPATDAGRKAGLGLAGGSLAPAWTAQDGTVRLPVYDRWEFHTAPDGDFARLARRLHGVAAPWRIGRRIMDTSRPGDPLGDLAPGEDGRRQVIRCALFSPNPAPPGAVSDTARWTQARTDALQAALERPAVIEGTAGTAPGAIPDLPIVGPRIYAKGQRGTSTIPAGDWFADLNLAPAHRVVGGLGTRVVVKDQEPLMQAAWAQVGEIDKANRALALAELARNIARTVHARLGKVDPGRLLQITRLLAPRVRLDGAALTLDGQTVRSATPTAALGGPFRRAVRANGPLTSRLAPAEQAGLKSLVADDQGARDFTRPYAEPDGIGGLSETALASIDAGALAQVLQVSPQEAMTRVRNASQLLATSPTLATAVTTPALWGAPDTSFNPGVAATERVVARIRERLPQDPAQDVVGARFLGGLAAGLAVSQVEGTAPMQDAALRLDAAVTMVASRAQASSAQAVQEGPMVGVAPVAGAPTSFRPGGAAMLRSAAAGGAFAPSGLSTRASGALAQPIVWRGSGLGVGPGTGVGAGVGAGTVIGAGAGAPPITDRARLDAFRTPQGTLLAYWAEQAAKVTVNDIRSEIGALVDASGVLTLPPTPARDRLAVSSAELLARLDPSRTVIDTMRARLSLGALAFDVFAGQLIRPIMAAPRFDRPMYEALDAYDREWLVPGLGTLPASEMVTLLSSNDEFTEAFLVGLSDEMGRELLWRNYPTDSRGTYFYRFWDRAKDELAEQIHRFSSSPLGKHVTLGPPGQSGRAVVVVRGEVVRRYPDLTVMALHETGTDPATNLPILPEAPAGMPDAAPSIFHAMLPPDVMLAGLDITIDALRAPGWWIVIGEHPQAVRFRRQEADLAANEIRFASPSGAVNGATVAHDRVENPTRIAFRAAEFLPAPS